MTLLSCSSPWLNEGQNQCSEKEFEAKFASQNLPCSFQTYYSIIISPNYKFTSVFRPPTKTKNGSLLGAIPLWMMTQWNTRVDNGNRKFLDELLRPFIWHDQVDINSYDCLQIFDPKFDDWADKTLDSYWQSEDQLSFIQDVWRMEKSKWKWRARKSNHCSWIMSL